jgi:hypothetical protein
MKIPPEKIRALVGARDSFVGAVKDTLAAVDFVRPWLGPQIEALEVALAKLRAMPAPTTRENGEALLHAMEAADAAFVALEKSYRELTAPPASRLATARRVLDQPFNPPHWKVKP